MCYFHFVRARVGAAGPLLAQVTTWWCASALRARLRRGEGRDQRDRPEGGRDPADDTTKTLASLSYALPKRLCAAANTVSNAFSDAVPTLGHLSEVHPCALREVKHDVGPERPQIRPRRLHELGHVGGRFEDAADQGPVSLEAVVAGDDLAAATGKLGVE